jgi:hypothetical protein
MGRQAGLEARFFAGTERFWKINPPGYSANDRAMAMSVAMFPEREDKRRLQDHDLSSAAVRRRMGDCRAIELALS